MDELLRVRARSAYERARWGRAFQSATWTVAVAGFAVLLQEGALWGMLLATAAVLTHVALAWTHDDLRDGALLGVGLGAAQVTAYVFMTGFGMRYFPASCDAICFGIVFMGSSGVGVAAARTLADSARQRLARTVSGMLVMGAMMILLGCLPGAVGLILGAAIGFSVGAVPSWIVFRQRTV